MEEKSSFSKTEKRKMYENKLKTMTNGSYCYSYPEDGYSE